MVNLTIDGIDIQVEKGTTILQAALKSDIKIPHYCYHPALKIDGNCRMCLVEVEKMPKLTIACNTVVSEGMVIKTDSPKVVKARRGVLEFFLVNHPLDCPVCDKAGECRLQDYSYTYGAGFSRFDGQKVVQPKKDLGEKIVLYSDRCILCARCVRFLRDVAGTGELDIINRGGSNEIDLYDGCKLENKLAGNVVDICPVGALKSKEFLFKRRVWYIRRKGSICPRCSVGCSIYLDITADSVYNYRIKERKVVRVVPRHNPYVNGYWMCDDGRYGWDEIHSDQRLTVCQRRGAEKLQPSDIGSCIDAIKENYKKITARVPDSAGVLLSAAATNEDNFLLFRLAKDLFKSKNISFYDNYPAGNEERFPLGFVIEKDKAPNRKGAETMLEDFGIGFLAIKEKILEGKIKFLIVINNSKNCTFLDEDLKLLERLDYLVVLDSYNSKLTHMANIVLPLTVSFESSGTFVNSRGVVQRFDKAVDNIHAGIQEGWISISKICNALGASFSYRSSGDIYHNIMDVCPSFSKLTHHSFKNDIR